MPTREQQSLRKLVEATTRLIAAQQAPAPKETERDAQTEHDLRKVTQSTR